jgi:xanthine dehydrogenase small subunit
MADADVRATIQLEVNGDQVEVGDDGASLLEVLRDRLGLRAAKDGCSPQGQCGCCTVLVDGAPRVACVTPVRRVRDRTITTLEGFDAATRSEWADAFCDGGASQCGFCTPGIIVRLEGLKRRGTLGDVEAVDRALAAHLCRCTGWQTIRDVAVRVGGAGVDESAGGQRRDLAAAAVRAELEGGAAQKVGTEVSLGFGGFADDEAPADALVAVVGPDGEWSVGETLSVARAAAAKVQGRRTTREPEYPLDLPTGEWAAELQTHWVDPAYLEVDVSWCEPGGRPASPLANGGAFGGKVDSPLPAVARRLADEHERAVVARWSREDSVRFGPKRPPVAGGIRSDGSGVLRVGCPSESNLADLEQIVATAASGLDVERVEIAGPPTSMALRAAVWAEAAMLAASVAGTKRITTADGAWAEAELFDHELHLRVSCGAPLDKVVLRSYCIGAAHMGLGLMTSEGLSVVDGEVADLTIRSFGIIRASDMPRVSVSFEPSDAPPRKASDAVFAAVSLEASRQTRQGLAILAR